MSPIKKISPTDLILNDDGSVYHLNLLPKHIPDTIIAVGDPSRVYNVSRHFDDIEFEMNKREFITNVGTYNGKRIAVISTGIGTDNVELFFTELDALINIDLKTREPKPRRKRLKVIRIGTSGALQEDIPVDSHLVSDYAIGFDNLMSFYNLPMSKYEKEVSAGIQEACGISMAPYVVQGSGLLMERIGSDMIKGNTVTTPGFYAPQGRQIRIPLKYPNLLDDLNRYHHRESNFWLTNFEMETAGYYSMARLLGHEVISVNAIIANRVKNKFSKNPNKAVDTLIKKVLERI